MSTDQYNVVKLSLENSEIWYDYIRDKKEATIFHHPLWLKTLRHETNQEAYILICADRDNKVVGGLPLQHTRGMYAGVGGIITHKRLSSLPRTPIMDILADNNTVRELLISKALEINNSERDSLFQLKCIEISNYQNLDNVVKIPWREEYYLTFPSDASELRFGDGNNHRKIKWAVNKAKKAGVKIKKECSPEELRIWYRLYLETCRWHATIPRPYKFFDFVYRELYPKGLMKIYIATITDPDTGKDNMITGSLLFLYNESVFYSYNGRNTEYLKLRPNDLIQWEAIHDAYGEGYKRYHFGEVSDGQDGLADFKNKWCNENKQIFHLYSESTFSKNVNLNSSYSGNLKLSIWRKIPLMLTQKIGNIIYYRL